MSVLDFLHRARVESESPALPLATALVDLDIEPFERHAVEKYKEEKKEATFRTMLPPNAGDWKLTALATEMARQYLYAPSIPSITDPVGLGTTNEEKQLIGHARLHGYDLRFYHDASGNYIPIALFLRWRRMSLAEAEAPPDYVTHKVNQILEKVPDAKIEVEVLESRKSSYDPFLVVSLGEEEFYVEVWGGEEREFSR